MTTMAASCSGCGFTTCDLDLLRFHSCAVESNGGWCEDYPACGHEYGDCNGRRYGSEAALRDQVRDHLHCEHEHGYCDLEED